MFLEKEQLDQIEAHIYEILPELLLRNPRNATVIEGILAQHFPRRDEFARLLDEFTAFRTETRERFDRVDASIGKLEAGQAKLEAGQAKLEAGQARLETRVGGLEGSDLERQFRERPFVYFSRFARKIKPVTDADFANLVENALDQERLSEDEAEDLKLIDAVARGRRKNDDEPLYLAIEASIVIDQHDLDRAVRRANLLQKATAVATMPIVAGKQIHLAVRQQAEQIGAGWVLRG